MKASIPFTLLFLVAFCAACSRIADYNHHFNEGQIYPPATVTKLHRGQSQDEVRAVMGDPLHQNTFDTRRWYYISHMKDRDGERNENIMVEFDASGRVERVVTSAMKTPS